MKSYYSKYNIMKSPEQRQRMSEKNPMKNKDSVKKMAEKISKKIVIGTTTYNSIKEASQKYNVYDTAIQYWLKRGYNSYGELCYYEGTKELNIQIKTHKQNCRSVYIGNKHFDTVKEGAKYLGISSSKLINIIKSNKPFKNKIICKYGNQQPSHENDIESIVEGPTTNE